MSVRLSAPAPPERPRQLNVPLLASRAKRVLRELGHSRSELSLALVDNAKIQALNREWRNRSRPDRRFVVLSSRRRSRTPSGQPVGRCSDWLGGGAKAGGSPASISGRRSVSFNDPWRVAPSGSRPCEVRGGAGYAVRRAAPVGCRSRIGNTVSPFWVPSARARWLVACGLCGF